MSQNLGTKWKKGVPLEVIPMATVPVMRKIEKELGGQATLRMANTKMVWINFQIKIKWIKYSFTTVSFQGPTVTDNGNFLIDWKFNEGQMRNWTEVNAKLKDIPGGLLFLIMFYLIRGRYCWNGTVCEHGMQSLFWKWARRGYCNKQFNVEHEATSDAYLVKLLFNALYWNRTVM